MSARRNIKLTADALMTIACHYYRIALGFCFLLRFKTIEI